MPINVNSFGGSGAVIKVAKKPGMESLSLLAEETSAESAKPKDKKKPTLWNSLSKCVCVCVCGGGGGGEMSQQDYNVHLKFISVVD